MNFSPLISIRTPSHCFVTSEVSQNSIFSYIINYGTNRNTITIFLCFHFPLYFKLFEKVWVPIQLYIRLSTQTPNKTRLSSSTFTHPITIPYMMENMKIMLFQFVSPHKHNRPCYISICMSLFVILHIAERSVIITLDLIRYTLPSRLHTLNRNVKRIYSSENCFLSFIFILNN